MGERVPLANLLIELSNGHPLHNYAFSLTERTVIDGARNGNDARFINHSCDPNCEAYVFDERVYIYAMRDIARNEELTFDYHLGPAFKGMKTRNTSADYECHCGSLNCRGTMIAQKRNTKRK